MDGGRGADNSILLGSHLNSLMTHAFSSDSSYTCTCVHGGVDRKKIARPTSATCFLLSLCQPTPLILVHHTLAQQNSVNCAMRVV